MKAVILAGGFGTRISEETDAIPKPMVTIGGNPIIWHIMKIYSHYGINEFVVCLGYKGYVLKEFFSNYFLHMCDVTFDMSDNSMEVHHSAAEPWRVTLLDTGATTLTGGRLRRVRNYLGEDAFCMTYGDGLADVDIGAVIEFHQSHGKKATVTAVNPPGRFGVLSTTGRAVSEVREKSVSSESFINGGFFVLEPSALDFIDGDHISWEQQPMQRWRTDVLFTRGILAAHGHTA